MGFNIGSVFLLLRGDGGRLQADIEQAGTAAADAAGPKIGQTLGSQMSAGLLKAGKQLESTGATLTKNVTAPIVGLGAAVVATGAQFDTTLRQIVALTDVTADEIGGVKDQVLALAEATGKDPNELAKGFYFLASAGFDTADAMKVLDTTAHAAAAGLGDTADISKVVGAAINAFGKGNLTAADATDQLLRAVKDGTAEAPDFAAALGQVLGTAGQMGATFADTTAAMAAMTLKGIDADTAAVSLNQVFVSLLKTTPQSAKALASVGLSAEGLRQELREKGLLAVLDTLRTSFEGNDTAAAAVFGNVRALRGVLALTTGDAKQTADVFNDVADGTDNVAKAFAETNGPGRELDKAVTEIKVSLIELSGDVLPSVVDGLHMIVGIIHGAVGVFKGLPGPLRGATVAMLALAATVGPVLFAFGKLSSGLGLAIKGIGKVAGKISFGGPLTDAITNLPVSPAVKGAITKAGGAIGRLLGVAVGVGLAAAGGLAIAFGFKALVLDPALQQQSRDIGAAVGRQIMMGTQAELLKSRGAIAKGIADIKALPFGELTHGDEINALQSQLDAIDEELNKRAAGIGHEVPAGIAGGFDHGWSEVSDAAANMVSGVDDVLAGTVDDAGTAGKKTAESYAQGVLAKQGAVSSAFDALKDLIKNGLGRGTRIARDIGILTSKKLAEGLDDRRGAVRKEAQLVQADAEQELATLILRGGKVGEKAADALAARLKSKNPKVRAAAQRTQAIVTNALNGTIKPAGEAGTAAGNAFATHLQSAVASFTLEVGVGGKSVAHRPRATGGPVAAGVPYIVNENTRRSEWFVPSTPGRVMTDSKAMKALSSAAGGNAPLIGNLTINAGGNTGAGDARRFGTAVVDVIKQQLREERRRQ